MPPLQSCNWVNCGLCWLIVCLPVMTPLRACRQCLLVLERLSAWISGGEELCVWSPDFQLQCHRRNHSDTGRDTQTLSLSSCKWWLLKVSLPLFALTAITICFWRFCRNNRFDRAAQELCSCRNGQRNRWEKYIHCHFSLVSYSVDKHL